MKQRKLNEEQAAAIKHKKGPLLVVAGAGTGKTTVIVERIKHLIEKGFAKPNEILALTFTEKAAQEMVERVDVALPMGYSTVDISTYHGFCDRLLRDEALHIGLSTDFKLLTQASQVQFLRDNLFEFDLDYFRPLGNPDKFIYGMLTHFSRLQDEFILPKEYVLWAKKLAKKAKSEEEKLESKKNLELANAYKKYDELKIKNGFLDFGDLIIKSLVLFKTRPNVLKKYQEKYKYILVDEFQDVNFAQSMLSTLLAGKSKNITVVGDDDQAIYRFRGASVSNILEFRKTFKNAKIIVLSKNYRSKRKILDAAYELIQANNPDRLEVKENINKHLEPARKGPGEIAFIHKQNADEEADAVSKKIKKLLKEGYKYSDVAVLVRANNHADSFVKSFERHGIPHQFLGPGKLFLQEEVIDLVSVLKILVDPYDSVSFYRVLAMDFFDIPGTDLAKIGMNARKKNISTFEAAQDLSDEKINEILTIITPKLKRARKEPTGKLLYEFMVESGIFADYQKASVEDEQKIKNVGKLFEKIKKFETDYPAATVRETVDWIELSRNIGDSPAAADFDWWDVDAVNILTVHGSKGLEFPIVFLVNLVTERFPSRRRGEQIPVPDELLKETLPEGDYHEEEERRLFYVGMTRARDRLFMTAADYYGEAKRRKRLSPFIFEALGDEAKALEEGKKKEKLPDFSYKKESVAKVDVKPLHIDYLSYSQIEAFNICPLHYKLKYILGVPTPPSPAQSIGSSVHGALQKFYLAVKSGKRPTKRLLEKSLDESWKTEGFRNKKHEKASFELSCEYLFNYYKDDFSSKKIPIVLEHKFVVNLNTPKGEKSLKIGGVIDRVDKIPNGIEIIDYKTGKMPSQSEVNKNLQLSFYALAATKLQEFPFGKKPEEVKLSLYYLEARKKMSTTRTLDQLKDAADTIFETRKGIEASDFACSGHIFCQNCEYSIFCKQDKD